MLNFCPVISRFHGSFFVLDLCVVLYIASKHPPLPLQNTAQWGREDRPLSPTQIPPLGRNWNVLSEFWSRLFAVRKRGYCMQIQRAEAYDRSSAGQWLVWGKWLAMQSHGAVMLWFKVTEWQKKSVVNLNISGCPLFQTAADGKSASSQTRCVLCSDGGVCFLGSLRSMCWFWGVMANNQQVQFFLDDFWQKLPFIWW